MLVHFTKLRGNELHAQDGVIGKVTDVYFDDHTWSARYFEVDCGQWLLSRKVLISPTAVHGPDWESDRLPVDLTKDQVRESPKVDTAQSLGRKEEEALHAHYAWAPYWGGAEFGGIGFGGGPGLSGGGAVPVAGARQDSAETKAAAEASARHEVNPHLRSMGEVKGYAIAATDGSIGHVEDFVVDDRDWSVRFVIVDTRNWLPGRKVAIAPAYLRSVDWAEGKVVVALTQKAIEESPAFDESKPMAEGYAEQLGRHYGERG